MIVGFSITKTNAERKAPANGQININFTPNIENVSTTTVSALDEDVAKIEFTFPITWKKNGDVVGEVNFTGEVLWKGNVEEIVDAWENDEQLPDDDTRLAILNRLYRVCLTRGVGVADGVGLPSPLPVPVAQKKE